MTHPNVIRRTQLLARWCHTHPLHISPQLHQMIDEFARWTPVTNGVIRTLVKHAACLRTIRLPQPDACLPVHIQNARCALWEYGPIQEWDTSRVTSMSQLFTCCNMLFEYNLNIKNYCCVNCPNELLRDNIYIGHWDTSAVTDMGFMFSGSECFNVDISRWNTSSVITMQYMFYCCKSFNQPIGNWDVSRVKDMKYMFFGCTRFNQPLQSWNVSNVKRMENMFGDCTRFNQPLAAWDVSQVRSMRRMFEGCTHFRQSVDRWAINEMIVDVHNMFWCCTDVAAYRPSWIHNR